MLTLENWRTWESLYKCHNHSLRSRRKLHTLCYFLQDFRKISRRICSFNSFYVSPKRSCVPFDNVKRWNSVPNLINFGFRFPGISFPGQLNNQASERKDWPYPDLNKVIKISQKDLRNVEFRILMQCLPHSLIT